MKSPIRFAIVAFSIGIISQGFAGPAPVSGAPGGFTTEPVVSGVTSPVDHSIGGLTAPPAGSSGAPGSSGTAPAGESKTDENDDTLYRGSTKDSENPMMMDEGPLHFKTRPKEKIQEVNSLKNLQSSGSDPKFQGSLLNSNVSSIEKVSEKAKETRDLTEEGDPRFRTKRLTFTADNNDEPKKAQSDSSPSPTPSPTTSPAAKNSGGSKQ